MAAATSIANGAFALIETRRNEAWLGPFANYGLEHTGSIAYRHLELKAVAPYTFVRLTLLIV